MINFKKASIIEILQLYKSGETFEAGSFTFDLTVLVPNCNVSKCNFIDVFMNTKCFVDNDALALAVRDTALIPLSSALFGLGWEGGEGMERGQGKRFSS